MFLLTLVVFINIAIISVESFSVFSFNESSLFPTKPPSFASASVENSELPDKFTICSSSRHSRYNLSTDQWPSGPVTLIWQPCKIALHQVQRSCFFEHVGHRREAVALSGVLAILRPDPAVGLLGRPVDEAWGPQRPKTWLLAPHLCSSLSFKGGTQGLHGGA